MPVVSSPRSSSGDASAPAQGGVRLFVMDVDGTMTDGTLTYGPDGGEWKTFHARDGMGVHLLHVAGIVPALVTGRSSEIVARRAQELGIKDVVQGAKDKAAEVRSLCRRHGVGVESAAYMGDDLSDLPPMREVSFAAAPADAAPEVRQAASFVAAAVGGRGAVREAVEALLRREGRWESVLAACVERSPQGDGDGAVSRASRGSAS